MAATLLTTARQRSRWARKNLLSSFCGKAVSQLVPLPLARFFTRSIYDSFKKEAPRRGRYPERTVKLSHAGLRDLQSWTTMLAGDGRLIGGVEPSWCLNTDAADLGYGATLGHDMRPGSQGEITVQGIWSPFLRLKSITLRELTAVRLALEDALVQAQVSGDKSMILLHVDNMAIFQSIRNMVSAKPELMQELRRLHHILVQMKFIIRANWLPSAPNRHADNLSRTWNPRDLAETQSLLESVATSLHLQTVRRYWLLGEAPAARRKVMTAQFAEHWGDGCVWLWNPPPPWIWATLMKIQAKGAHGIIIVPHWTGAPWFAKLKTLLRNEGVIEPEPGHQLFSSDRAKPAWGLLLCEVGKPQGKHFSDLLPLSSLKLPLEGQLSA